MGRVRLNPQQREAVDHDLGPLLVLAGAGSGKTGVVTQRIARLIGAGVGPKAILAVTFTNKAAAEMQERVVRAVGAKKCAGLLTCTFHRFGLEVLSREARVLGMRGGRFAIYDRGDCAGVIRDALRGFVTGKNWDIGAVLNRISLAKNAFIDAEAFQKLAHDSGDPYDEITALAYPKYEAALRSLQAFDFDDLVCEPVRLWRRRPEVLARWKARFRYVIVDEYQDTNQAQLEMLRALVGDHKNLCVVGDDDQAIYAWRGADVRNILDFERDFPGSKVVRLEQNYRSSEAVLEVANAILEGSSARRHKKRLIPTRGPGDKVKLVVALDGATEARWVAEEAGRMIDTGRGRPKDIAVLYRSNLQAGEIEAELRARGVPYQLFGGTQTFERKEVKDLLAYLEVAVEGGAELAVRRSLNYPARGVGDVALEKLGHHATLHDTTLYNAVERAHAVAGLNDRAREGCRDYIRVVNEVRRALEAGTPSAEMVGQLAESIELRKAILAECGDNNKAAGKRWSNVAYLIRAFERRDQKAKMDRDALAQFLRVLMLREEQEDDEAVVDKVTLTTIHGAKGLEFRYVFLVGLEEGLLPHARSLDERITDAAPANTLPVDELEQERRLFYVAVTRAKEQLYLCHARGRQGRGKMLKRTPSRFLTQIPEALLERVDVLEPPKPDVATAERGARDVLAAIFGAGGKSA